LRVQAGPVGSLTVQMEAHEVRFESYRGRWSSSPAGGPLEATRFVLEW